MEYTLMKDVYYPQHLPNSSNYWGIAESLSKFMAKGLDIWSPFDPPFTDEDYCASFFIASNFDISPLLHDRSPP